MKESAIPLYSNKMGNVSQGVHDGKLWIEFQGVRSPFSVHCFFSLKKKVEAIDLPTLVNDPDSCSDYVIINPCGCERIFALRLRELVVFKDLLQGASVMLELNSIIYQRLHNILV